MSETAPAGLEELPPFCHTPVQIADAIGQAALAKARKLGEARHRF